MRPWIFLGLAAALFACDDDTSPPRHDGLGSDGAFLDGKVSDGKVSDGKVSDGKASDGKASDGKASDGTAGDGTAGDGTAGDGTAGDGSAGDGTANDGTLWADFFFPDGFNPGNKVACHGKVYACSDGLDNDGDKLIDAQDPECTGPCDNDEGSFELNIPGVNRDPCKQDCYWDYDSGDGNDDCYWNHKCDPLGPGASHNCPYNPSFTNCPTTQSATCLQICLPVTPNGCDCFGCCEIYVNGKKYAKTVFLGSGTSCTAKAPQNCAACTQQTSCLNSCGPCELCLGKTVKDLPPWCFNPKPTDGGPAPGDGLAPFDGTAGDGTAGDGAPPVFYPWCDPGVVPCLFNSHCPTSYYCITGCCQLSIS